MLLIPLEKACRTAQDVADLIQRVFKDIDSKKALAEFQVAGEMRQGVGRSLLDAIVLEPNIAGIGLDMKKCLTTV